MLGRLDLRARAAPWNPGGLGVARTAPPSAATKIMLLLLLLLLLSAFGSPVLEPNLKKEM